MKIRDGVFEHCENIYENIFTNWPFPLSDFQKWAIYSIYNNSDTLVCAPTGSGKTLPAEFAIEHFVNKLKKKVIYTTPVKALSNEKYYALSKKYPNISFGLITGDNKFNPEADVIIMTTEILLNTLDKIKFLSLIEESQPHTTPNTLDFEIDIEKELGCVIFDEIHYINDSERGHVWEKCIMKIPTNVIYIGLSATINGPEKFCEWSESVRKNEIYLCRSTHRNVPLEHYSFTSIPESNLKNISSDNFDFLDSIINKPILLKKQNLPFEEQNYDKIKKVLKYITDTKININYSFMFNKIIEYMFNNNLLPGLAFVFSRKQCYAWAARVDRILFKEGSTIPSIIEKKATQILIKKLSNWKEYVELPEFKNIIKLLQKGIAVHHSGVTPVFREMIELLYGEGYIKLLIATETFAIGINMGIKAVIYTSLQKFDGHGFRFLHAHEYGQGSGRAGRRGKDNKGVIFHLNALYNSRNNNPDTATYRTILSGTPQKLVSKFTIDFNLILSLLHAGVTNISKFVNSSMLKNELNKERQYIQDELSECSERANKANKGLELLHTKRSVLSEYSKLINQLNKPISKKKRKQIKRELITFGSYHNNLEKDYQKWLNWENIVNEKDKLEQKCENILHYVHNEIALHCDILKKFDFIKNTDDGYQLTNKGLVSANIHEIHSLAIADILVDGTFEKLTTEEIVSVLSIFTGVRLSEDDKYHSISKCDVNCNIKDAVEKIELALYKYHDIEAAAKTNFSQSYDVQYDMCEFLYAWCFAKNESDCRKIYDEAKKFNIYIGEFVKAILKIVNICNELEKVATLIGNLLLLNKLSYVKDTILKSIATNQSLYL